MKFLISLLLDAIVLLSLFFGVYLGEERLINIACFALWFFGVVNLIGFLIPSAVEKAAQDYVHRTLFRRAYDLLTDIAMVVFAAWSGWWVLAAIYGLTTVLKAEFSAKQEKKITEQAVQE
ncbi:hypothetical protein F384_22510 [Citrobacter amalonaticus Y19]|uniref:Uncharacterized protein n=1 Tax=Citrobacter amalonaticus Y19 TaxID=1261127 RepID=A0A0F6TYQ3_CITAM|nr:hypothetical protein [Citrobacter amalonaticus]AKE61137.1 hypothetical protein F384_22510 [Citrobacter amalonaticus Y19]